MKLRVIAVMCSALFSVGSLGIGVGGAGATSSALSPLRVQQLLARLNYLPVSFHATGGSAAGTAAQPGTFSWRWAVPGALKSQWVPGVSNVIEQGAIMSFQRQNGLGIDGVAGPATVQRLLVDVRKNLVSRQVYNAVYVSEQLPEMTYLYENGHLKFTSLANTGVPGAATELGTWPVYLRYQTTTMTGTNLDGSRYYDTGIPWTSYFHGGDALHGFIRSTYGWPQSLGCVEMPFAKAKVLWPNTPLGTLVTVGATRP